MKALARLISLVFNPFIIPTIVAVLAVVFNQYAFGGRKIGMVFILQMFIWTFFIPLIALVIMKSMEMVSSTKLRDRQERIIPYFLLLSCYSIIFYFVSNLGIPFVIKAILAGFILSIVLGLFLNNFFMISAHGISMGALLGASLGLAWLSVSNIDWLILVVLVLSALVLSSRVYLNLQGNREVFAGFAVGFVSQAIAILVYLNFALVL